MFRFFDYKVETIRPLNDARAVELGASFMSEAILFSVAGLTIFAEAWRSSRKAGAKTLSVDEAIARLEAERLSDLEIIGGLREQVSYLGKENDCLREAVHNLADSVNPVNSSGRRSEGWLGFSGGVGGMARQIQDIQALTLEAEDLSARRHKLSALLLRSSPLGTDVVESGIEAPIQ
jgi:hypothetical protein